ncbi:MAG: RNA methyltransferase [Bacteroidota bacterium]
MRTERRLQKIRRVLRDRQPDLTVVLENIHDPHNVSAILRSADAVGIAEVHLVYTTEEFPRIGRKSSASASKWVVRRKWRSVEECYSRLRKQGFKIYASQLDSESLRLFDLNLRNKGALVFGNEHQGVSEEAAALADARFIIPMYGMIESLNVSVACAVSLYEALRQRLEHGGYSKPKLSDTALRGLAEEWSKK